MKQFFQKKIHTHLLLVILLIITSQLNAQKKAVDLSFEEVGYSIDQRHSNQLIKTYKEAKKLGLTEKSNKTEEFYGDNILYLFQIGGGCFTPKPSEISIKAENNLIKITLIEPSKPCPETGKYGPFFWQNNLVKKGFSKL